MQCAAIVWRPLPTATAWNSSCCYAVTLTSTAAVRSPPRRTELNNMQISNETTLVSIPENVLSIPAASLHALPDRAS
jgi:hypothetical protein